VVYKVLVVVERGFCGVVMDESEVVEGEEESVVGTAEDESGLDDSEDEDNNALLVTVVEFAGWAKVVLGHAARVVMMIASEYLILDIVLGF
jgi:hypothetical protein